MVYGECVLPCMVVVLDVEVSGGAMFAEVVLRRRHVCDAVRH